MKKVFAFVVLAILLFATQAQAKTIYIDCLNGSDSNTTNAAYPGAAGTGPYKTPQAVSNGTGGAINAGDTIAIKSGTVCRPVAANAAYILKPNGASQGWGGTVANPVILTSYGAGPKPILDGADCVGAQTGNCIQGPIISGSWASCSAGCPAVNANIFKFTYANPPFAVFKDSETGFPSLLSATCFSGTCLSVPHGGAVEVANKLPAWASSTSYSAGDAVMSNTGNWYTSGSTAVSGATQPTCNSGTCSDGTITWTFRGRSSATTLAMVPGSWFWDGAALYIWMPAGDTPANHSVEVSDLSFGVIWIAASGGELNGELFDNIELRHGKDNFAASSGLSGGINLSGFTFNRVTMTQAGTCPVDDLEDAANINFNGSSNSTPATGLTIRDSNISYGCKANITFQCTQGTTITGNTIAFSLHGNVNNRDNVVCPNDNTGDQIIGNNIYGGYVSVSGLGDPNGIYIENPDATTLVANNNVYNGDDVSPCAGGACAAISFFKGSGFRVINNTVDGYTAGIQLDSGQSNIVVLDNNVSTRSAPTSYALEFTSGGTCTSCTFDLNDWYANGSNPIFFGGSGQSFAAWQASAGSPDAHGISTALSNVLPLTQYQILKNNESTVQQ